MTATKNAPAYVRFVTALVEEFAAAGVPLVPVADPSAPDGLRGPKGWVLLETPNGDKTYLKRTEKGDPSTIETTVPLELLPAGLITKDMRGLNGKIEARLKQDVSALASGLIPALARRLESGEKLRPSKAPVRAASGQEKAAAVQAVRVGTEADL